MAITPLPTPPSRSDPANFADRGDAFLGALPTFVTEANALAAATNQNEINAELAETNAETAQAAAEAAQLAAENARDAAQLAETNAETAEVNAETAETNASNSANAAAASAASAAAIAGAFVSTSTTSWTPTIGSQAFTVQAGEQYTAGIFVTIVSASLASNWGFGQVTSYSGTTLTVDVQVISGSTSKTDWNISLTGARGAKGDKGDTGTGITEQSVGFTLTGGTTSKTLTVVDTLSTADLVKTSDIGTSVQAYDADLTTWAGKTAPSGVVVGTSDAQTLTNKTISVDDNTVSGVAASSFVLSNGSGNIDGSAAQKAIPSGVVVGTSDAQTLTNKTISGASNTMTVDGTNSVGYKNIPYIADKTASYTLATGDVGKVIGVGSGGSIIVPNSTFAAGDAVVIFNNTTGNITITCTITTAYIGGTDTDKATVTLATRGVCNILFVSATVCVITGNVS